MVQKAPRGPPFHPNLKLSAGDTSVSSRLPLTSQGDQFPRRKSPPASRAPLSASQISKVISPLDLGREPEVIDGQRPWSVFSARLVIVRMIVRMVSNSIGRQAMATVKCPKCPATVELTHYFRRGERVYNYGYGSDLFDWCLNPVRAAGDPDRTPKCPDMEEAVTAATRSLDNML